MKWTQEEHNYLVQLKEKGLMWHQIAEEMTIKFGRRYTKEQCRSRWRQNRHLVKNEIDPKDKYGKKISKNPDGTWEIDQLIEISKEQLKDDTYILEAHGYDSSKWEITSHQFSMWEHHNKVDGTIRLHASKIKIAPKKNNEYEDLIETIENGKPFNIELNYKVLSTKHLLEIAPVDTHFGISSLKYYEPNLVRIVNKIRLRHWEQIVIPVGNDLFHNDDFRGRTSSGREIQKVDMRNAWIEAEAFYFTIIDEAIKNSNHVKIVYVRGNHDESMSWAFVRNLMTKYPNLEFDDSYEEHKGHLFHDVFIGFTHGEKNRKNTANIFNTKFRLEIARSKVREIHQAHLHGEEATDHYGIMVRTLSTGNQEDEWHDQNGYVGKNKRFQLFEYSTDTLESIHYV
jgi:hypothetical protein